jgi:hypothetical protein
MLRFMKSRTSRASWIPCNFFFFFFFVPVAVGPGALGPRRAAACGAGQHPDTKPFRQNRSEVSSAKWAVLVAGMVWLLV